MTQSTEYEHELTGSRDEIAALLTGVADGLRTGAIRLGDTADAVAVTTPEELTLEIELEVEDDAVELELELEWPAEAGSVSAVEAAASEPSPRTEADGTDPTNEEADSGRAGESESESEQAAEDPDDAEATIGEQTPGTETDSAASTSEESGDMDSLIGAADESRSLAQFEVYRARDSTWRWRLRHRNGNIIATGGQGYTRKHNAVKGLRSVMVNSPDAPIGEEAADAWPLE
ncbi:amphi-Trp domain-containing protein [Halosegnis longus]|uniref:DUF1508 domain-containing protein n=1 Tax=Halosegnis longus TaxID=2216012 RepID=A0AAJ4UVS8_9EURY|nr:MULTISPECIES: amphi-Trp domain-containing protein [Halobacteriales]RNJ26347.1 DUF1508 domain-containing protein [Salella cibi]